MIIDKIYDNTKDGVPNYSFDLIDGTRLYYRGVHYEPYATIGRCYKLYELSIQKRQLMVINTPILKMLRLHQCQMVKMMHQPPQGTIYATTNCHQAA